MSSKNTKKASVLALEMAGIASKASGILYEKRCEIIKKLTDFWKCGEEVSVVKLTNGKYVYTDIIVIINSYGIICSQCTI